MGVGTSMGAYYDDTFHRAAADWDNKYDDNVMTPGQLDQGKQMQQIENDELGGTEVGLKGTALSDSIIKEFQAFRNLGQPYRDQRDGAIAIPEPPPPDDVTLIHPM